MLSLFLFFFSIFQSSSQCHPYPSSLLDSKWHTHRFCSFSSQTWIWSCIGRQVDFNAVYLLIFLYCNFVPSRQSRSAFICCTAWFLSFLRIGLALILVTYTCTHAQADKSLAGIGNCADIIVPRLHGTHTRLLGQPWHCTTSHSIPCIHNNLLGQ